MTHTPTPWGIIDRDHLVAGLDTVADRHLIAACYGTSPANKWANTEFIATACNSHAHLVEACKAAYDYMYSIKDDSRAEEVSERVRCVLASLGPDDDPNGTQRR